MKPQWILDPSHQPYHAIYDHDLHEQFPPHQSLIQLDSHGLDWYGSYLKKQYVEVLFTLQVSANKYLPSPTQKIFNLAIIKKENIQRGKIDNEFVHKIIRG